MNKGTDKGTKKGTKTGKTDEEVKAQIEQIIREKHPKSISELGRLMGYGKISGSLSKRIRTLIPGIDKLFKMGGAIQEIEAGEAKVKKAGGKKAITKAITKGTAGGTKGTKKATADKAKPNSPQSKKFPRVEGNPYREGSAYALCFDVFANLSKDKPAPRKAILEAYVKESGKDTKHAGYDLSVVLSPTKEGTGHRSSKKFAYYVARVGDGLKLVMAN